MSKKQPAGPETHFICQLYEETKAGRGRPPVLTIKNQFTYSTADQAEERARRAFDTGLCVGSDAYFVVSEPDSGDVGDPTFLARFGAVPQLYY